MQKYNDIQIVNSIMAKNIWQNQTIEQLIDAIGKPLEISKQVYKTKTKETWKYQKTGSNRFKLKVIIENDIVVGWDKK